MSSASLFKLRLSSESSSFAVLASTFLVENMPAFLSPPFVLLVLIYDFFGTCISARSSLLLSGVVVLFFSSFVRATYCWMNWGGSSNAVETWPLDITFDRTCCPSFGESTFPVLPAASERFLVSLLPRLKKPSWLLIELLLRVWLLFRW